MVDKETARILTLAELQKRGGDAPAYAPNRNMQAYSPPPSERDIRNKIYDHVYAANDWVGRSYIADKCKVRKTTWLNKHIEQLVIEGYLVKTETTKLNGMKQFWYGVPR